MLHALLQAVAIPFPSDGWPAVVRNFNKCVFKTLKNVI